MYVCIYVARGTGSVGRGAQGPRVRACVRASVRACYVNYTSTALHQTKLYTKLNCMQRTSVACMHVFVCACVYASIRIHIYDVCACGYSSIRVAGYRRTRARTHTHTLVTK